VPTSQLPALSQDLGIHPGKLSEQDIVDKGITTLMLHGLPRWLTQRNLMEALQYDGFDGTFDFLHVPFSIQKGCCTGYGFINFKSSNAAAALCENWKDLTWSGPNLPMNFSAADQQGFEACVSAKALNKWKRIRDTRLIPFICAEQRQRLGVQPCDAP